MNKNKRLFLRGQEKIGELEVLKRDIKFNFEYLELNKIIIFFDQEELEKHTLCSIYYKN